jgi:hypothetical protein
MKISVHWQKVWRAYFKLLGYSLLIPLASFLLLIGFIWYEYGFASGVRHPDALLELAIFKLKIYSVLALIGLIGMAVTDFFGALFSNNIAPAVTNVNRALDTQTVARATQIKKPPHEVILIGIRRPGQATRP